MDNRIEDIALWNGNINALKILSLNAVFDCKRRLEIEKACFEGGGAIVF